MTNILQKSQTFRVWHFLKITWEHLCLSSFLAKLSLNKYFWYKWFSEYSEKLKYLLFYHFGFNLKQL